MIDSSLATFAYAFFVVATVAAAVAVAAIVVAVRDFRRTYATSLPATASGPPERDYSRAA